MFSTISSSSAAIESGEDSQNIPIDTQKADPKSVLRKTSIDQQQQQHCIHQFIHTSDSDCSDLETHARSSG
jgi:hypothetical protein